jgi:16S rRNA processing protein RimM
MADGEVFLGRLVKPFGIRGELKLQPSQDFWEDVLASKHLLLERHVGEGREHQPVTLERSRPHGNNYVLKVEGVEDRNAAETLVGTDLVISAESIDVSFPGYLLPFQVIGCKVKSEDGVPLGKVTSVLFSPAHDLYEIRGEESVFLLPAVPEFILSMDDTEKELVIRTIPGLIDG